MSQIRDPRHNLSSYAIRTQVAAQRARCIGGALIKSQKSADILRACRARAQALRRPREPAQLAVADLGVRLSQALDTPTLLDGAQQAFGLTFESKGARVRFRNNSLAKALRVAAVSGEVERMEGPNLLDRPGVWRWRPPQSALAELQVAALEAEE